MILKGKLIYVRSFHSASTGRDYVSAGVQESFTSLPVDVGVNTPGMLGGLNWLEDVVFEIGQPMLFQGKDGGSARMVLPLLAVVSHGAARGVA